MTVNDVVLAAVAGALRRHAERRGERPRDLKAMVPGQRPRGRTAATLGNRITFMFVELPASTADPSAAAARQPERRARARRRACPRTPTRAIKALAYAPRSVQTAAAHALASPRVYNLVVSNIPGPRDADVHARLPPARGLSGGAARRPPRALGRHDDDRRRACFGLYADPETLPDADALAHDLDAALDELRATMRPMADTSRPASGSATRFRRSPSPTPTA